MFKRLAKDFLRTRCFVSEKLHNLTFEITFNCINEDKFDIRLNSSRFSWIMLSFSLRNTLLKSA